MSQEHSTSTASTTATTPVRDGDGGAGASGRGHRERLHRFLRAVLSRWPMKRGAAWMNRRLDRFFEGRDPNWLLAPGQGDWPTMELDVAVNLQRKFFYFPKVYGRFYGGAAFRRFLEQTLRPGSRFLDIGANVGFFSLMAARLVGPTGRVYAFEPEPRIFEALARSARVNGYEQLQAFQLALSDREDELAFYRARDGTASSLVPEAPGREARYERTLTARVTSLDRLVAEGKLDISGLTAIKVDVEGEEVRTVAGMRESLAAAGYPPIWCEVRGPADGPGASTRAPNTYPGVRALLEPLGYRPFRWAEGDRVPITDAEVTGRADVLFERVSK